MQPNNLVPLAPYVIVRRHDVKKQFADMKIVLPDEQNFVSRYCTVLAVHEGRLLKSGEVIPASVKPGDVVMVIKFDGEKINEYEDPSIEKVDEDQILCVVEGETDLLSQPEFVNMKGGF